VNIAPPALLGVFVGVLVTFLTGGGFHGLGNWVLTTAWSPDVANVFLGPGATPGNFVQTFVAAWEFLVPTAIVAAIVAYGLTRSHGAGDRESSVFGYVALANIALPPVLMMLLAPFLAVGTAGGILNFVIGGIKMLILPIWPLVFLVVFLILTALAGWALYQRLDDPILAAALALIPMLVPLMLIPIGSFLLKTLFFSFLVFWLWFTLPRVRVDQFLRIGWKVMFPLSLVTLTLAGFEAWLLRGGAL
jgi:hypothetical protein